MSAISVEEYIRSGYRRIPGWMSPESAKLVKAASDVQRLNGTVGSVGEIGVHHGRLFILLCLLSEPGEHAFAIDVFDDQHLNLDRSGSGDRIRFEHNLRRAGVDMTRVTVIQKSSCEVSPQQLRSIAGGVRMFSIDGGHTTAITLNDLALAESTLADGGIAILDDVFQPLYPGVTAGLARYLLGGGGLVPFAVSTEKVLLTHPNDHGRLSDALAEAMGPYFHRREDFFGHEVAIYHRAPQRNEQMQLAFAQSDVYAWLREAPGVRVAVRAIRPAVLRLMKR